MTVQHLKKVHTGQEKAGHVRTCKVIERQLEEFYILQLIRLVGNKSVT